MSSPEKLEANRANAQLSTGPRTEAGKHSSSQNALCNSQPPSAISSPERAGDSLAPYSSLVPTG